MVSISSSHTAKATNTIGYYRALLHTHLHAYEVINPFGQHPVVVHYESRAKHMNIGAMEWRTSANVHIHALIVYRLAWYMCIHGSLHVTLT